MFERFTDRARRVLVIAYEEARMHNHEYLGAEHLLLGLLQVDGGGAANVMESLGIVPAAVRQAVEKIIGRGEQAPSEHIPYTPRAKKVLELSLREALRRGDNHVGTEHLLLGLVSEGEGVAAQVLVRFGADMGSIDRILTQWQESSADSRGTATTSRKAKAKRTGPYERFTDRARRVIVLAQEEAQLLNHDYIGTEHLLLGLLHEGAGLGANTLTSLGITLSSVRQQVEKIIGRGQKAASEHIPFTPQSKKALELSLREALQLGHSYIGTEHILLGLIREGEGVAAQVLLRSGADLVRVRTQVLTLLNQGPAVS